MKDIKATPIDIEVGKKTATVTCGDIDFQKTLTDREKQFIHDGCNWISKLGRETTLKGLHLIGYTLDQVEALPDAEQKEIHSKADEAWMLLRVKNV